MELINFQVREVHQSGGDHVVSYSASVELIPGEAEVSVVVDSYLPETTDPKMADMAAASIRAGILEVLETNRMGARVRLDGVVIYPVDFSTRMYEQHTAEHFQPNGWRINRLDYD